MQIKIGCHVSIAGGIFNAPKNAAQFGCETFQIFSRSPQGGPAPKLTPEVVTQFKTALQEHSLSEFVIHAPYYINFGSPLPRTLGSSIAIVRDELERGSILGAQYVMFHPGSLKGNEDVGLEQVKNGLVKVLDGYKGSTQLLIEISAGAGAVAGDTFEELAFLLKPLKKHKGFGGICYDTQHGFASGYDIRTAQAAAQTFQMFAEVLGLEYLRMSHVNDSKVEFASHKDRHEHIGDGHIGDKGIAHFIAELQRHTKSLPEVFPLILETEHDKVLEDIKLLKHLRG